MENRKLFDIDFTEFGFETELNKVEKLVSLGAFDEANNLLCNTIKSIFYKTCEMACEAIREIVEDGSDWITLDGFIKETWLESCIIINDMWFNKDFFKQNAEEIFREKFQKYIDSIDQEIYDLCKKYPKIDEVLDIKNF